MKTSAQIGLDLSAKRAAIIALFADHKNDAGEYDLTAEQLGEIEKRNDEVVGLQAEFEKAAKLEKIEDDAKRAGRPTAQPTAPVTDQRIKTADQFSAAFKTAWDGQSAGVAGMASGARGVVRFEIDVEAKTLVTLSDMAPPPDRLRVAPSALFFGNVEDLFPTGSTNANNIEFYVQTTDTDNAAMVAEGSAVTDSAFSWTKTTDEVEIVQDWIPVTREFLNDNAGVESVVTGMLAARLQKKVNQQLLSGTGTTPQLWGVINRTGIQTQAKGADPAFDAIGKAIMAVQVTGDADPSAVVMHPTDWWNLRLTRTSDGVYILGNPSDGSDFTLFGLPVRITTGIGSAGTAVVGAFATQAQVFNNGGLTVEASTEHSTFFTERKVALALSRRLSVAWYRPNAFVKVTGL